MNHHVNSDLSEKVAEEIGADTLTKRREEGRIAKGNCYLDAARAILLSSALAPYRKVYTEGVALPESVPVPIEHAWVMVAQPGGWHVVDPSWVGGLGLAYHPLITMSSKRLFAFMETEDTLPLFPFNPLFEGEARRALFRRHLQLTNKLLGF